jgi:curved DNA-binding protein CbpA
MALGLPPDAVLQQAALKAAFHSAAKRWHPDRHAAPDAKTAAEARFKAVKEAYEALTVLARA